MLSENMPMGVIHSETVRDAIGSAAQNVLETMYFTILEAEASVGSALPSDHTVRATLTFSGEWNGSFLIETTAQAAREIAANFTGMMGPAEVGDQTAGEVLGEMANMVCGSILSFLGRQKLFNLGSPRIISAAGSQLAAVEFSPEYFTVERTFVLDSGPAIRFAIASAAFGG